MAQEVFKTPDQLLQKKYKELRKLNNNAWNNATKFRDPYTGKGGVDEWDYMVSQFQRHGIPVPENASGWDERDGVPSWVSYDDDDNEVWTPIDLTKFSQRPIAPNQFQLISPGLKNVNGGEILDIFNKLNNEMGPDALYNIKNLKGLNALEDNDLQALADAWKWKYMRNGNDKYFYRHRQPSDDGEHSNFMWKKRGW